MGGTKVGQIEFDVIMEDYIEKNRKQLGLFLKTCRNSRHRSLRDVAAASGISYPNLSRIENGTANVTVDTVIRYAHELGIDVVPLSSR